MAAGDFADFAADVGVVDVVGNDGPPLNFSKSTWDRVWPAPSGFK